MGNAEVLRRLRAEAVQRGLCAECRARPVKEGRKTCQVCLDRRYERAEQRKARGRCIDCGRKCSVRSVNYCAKHIDQYNAWVYKRAKRHIAEGKCRICSAMAKPGRTMCERHLKSNNQMVRARYYERVQEGRCGRHGCEFEPAPGHVYCDYHLTRMREASRKRRAA